MFWGSWNPSCSKNGHTTKLVYYPRTRNSLMLKKTMTMSTCRRCQTRPCPSPSLSRSGRVRWQNSSSHDERTPFPQLGPSTWRGRVASRLARPCGCLLRLRVGLFCLMRRPRPPISTFYCKEEKLGQLNDYLHVHHHHHHRLAFL